MINISQTNTYNNPFFYNRSSSVAHFDKNNNVYEYVADLTDPSSIYKPVYGSSVSFISRLNKIETIDNSLKVLPASENNLTAVFNLKFILNDADTGNLLKTIEVAQGTRYLKFKDPSNLYQDMVGLVEGFKINKIAQNLNEMDVAIECHIKTPMFNWRTSSFLKNITINNTNHNQASFYPKYSFVYKDVGLTDPVSLRKLSAMNKINNFWFAKEDINIGTPITSDVWTKNFFYEAMLPFEVANTFDFFRIEYKNSFIQNVQSRENNNSLKDFNIKFESISDAQCRSMLFFLEKKCGYRKFIYEFPAFLKEQKVFICTQWSHVFKFKNSNDLTLKITEDPNPSILIDSSNPSIYNYYVI